MPSILLSSYGILLFFNQALRRYSKRVMKGILKKILRGNIIFSAIVTVTISSIACFIIIPVSMILVKGVPGLPESMAMQEIQFAVKLSLITSFASTILCILLALPAAYGLTRFNFLGKKFISTIIDIPIALPHIVSGIALLLLFGTTAFGRALSERGLQFVFTPAGIVMAQFFVNLPYMIKILKSAFYEIDPRLEFVARSCGCTRLRSFTRVTLPLARNGLIAGAVITWARSLGEFGAVLMLAGATRMKTNVLPISLYLNFSSGEIDAGLAVASMLIIISCVSLFIFQFPEGSRFQFEFR